MIAVVLGLEYAAAAILALEDGGLARLRARLSLAWRVAREDRLAAVWRAEEAGGEHGPAPWRSLLERCAGWWLRADGSLARTPGGWRLSPRGRRDAEMVVRSHRLWEA